MSLPEAPDEAEGTENGKCKAEILSGVVCKSTVGH